MSRNMMPLSFEALRARSYKGAADYCAYPVASMESDDLHLPDQLPPGVTL